MIYDNLLNINSNMKVSVESISSHNWIGNHRKPNAATEEGKKSADQTAEYDIASSINASIWYY